ncbi:MAG: tRNA pseudouridine(55) synthase TruB [Arenicellales bacterium]|jgi:tRNA pseudouridine55 synthase
MVRRSRQRGRKVDGILLLDKPAGLTSNAALQEVKRAFSAAKAGHTGSLDPIATGLLPICFGEATKLSGFFLSADKRYRAGFRLGVATETGDSEGAVTRRSRVDLDDQDIERVMAGFRGEFEQVPSMYSAIKKDGKPLYELARQGIEVERQPRPVKVYSLEWRRLEDDRLAVDLHCSSGFYVRSLAQDVGDALGCGAHVDTLSRTAVGEFKLEDAVSLDRIRELRERRAGLDELLIPGDRGLQHLPGVVLSSDAAYYLVRGQAVRAASLPRSGLVRLYAEEAGFLGVGKVLGDGRVAPKRLFQSV